MEDPLPGDMQAEGITGRVSSGESKPWELQVEKRVTAPKGSDRIAGVEVERKQSRVLQR